ncbi:unnamed protein product [Brassicogethes aeneus]|uniref:Uncharacterized protein n=1 Tax=Brassicogethes aeneus TaxID=1431903 RepID=A0A9P0B4F7_BRAAE|nr:unnamed protein product [Brassicogethes aeneus]
MSTPRAIRGTKIKVIFIFCIVFILAGILTGAHNILIQLVELKESSAICHQQEENLSTQLQVISDYKQRLEKSLKIQNAENQQKRIQLEQKIEDEKVKYEEQINELKQKYESSQQHFNLLQTNYDDLKQTDVKKIKELEETINTINKNVEHLKANILQAQLDKENLQKKYDNDKFNEKESENEINHLKKINRDITNELDILKNKESPAEFKISSSVVSPPNKNLLSQPNAGNLLPSKSTTKSGVQISSGSLNNARPIGVPTVTPKSMKEHILFGIPKDLDEMQRRKLPDGVAPIPNANADSNDPTNNRYRIVDDPGKVDDAEKENGAQEQVDIPIQRNNKPLKSAEANDVGLGFNENEAIQQAQKANFDKNHIDSLGVRLKDDKADYNELQNEVPVEDPEEDDEQDEYGAPMARNKDFAIRN